MGEKSSALGGFVCAPYLHDHDSIELKDNWVSSKNIESLYFVTATFSEESKPYFSTSSNHYILAKFKDPGKIAKEILAIDTDKPSFLFNHYQMVYLVLATMVVHHLRAFKTTLVFILYFPLYTNSR